MAKNDQFDHQKIEEKWRKKWEEERIYSPDLKNAKKPFYNLMMFPYPSAEGLHVGNVYAFTGSDVYGRFQRMKGNDVFEPIGLDGFGIHSENYALKIGKNPMDQSKISEKNFYRQLHMIGNGFDWSKKTETYDPSYYKWTQWLFIQLYKAGLAEKRKAPVNWCPSCKTVLADEQVVAGKSVGKTRHDVYSKEGDERLRVCERCGTKVETRELEQWFFKITKYADRLLEDIKKIDWSEKVVTAQRNWIGKSEGIVLKFETDMGSPIEVFTTRPDTFHEATFIAVSVDHPFLKSVKNLDNEVLEYIKKSKVKSQRSKVETEKSVSGVFTGHYAKHPLTEEKLPIWVANYVLMEYGEGAIMGVPDKDERDLRFAKKYDLPVKEIKLESIEKAFEELEEKRIGKRKTNYHLRDWLISRQRYWGAPIPMINCPKCGWQPVREDDLPVILPFVENFKPLGTHSAGSGQAVGPLAQDENFVNTKCPNCTGAAKRETDVCDTFLDSSWYYLRYPSIAFDTVPFDGEITKKWLPVDMYIGGAEHSVLHLLYSRFITKALFDLKYLDFDEPFPKFRAHGLLIKEGSKMSKSKGNIVNPDEYIVKFGADTLRCYLMFSGPFEQGGDFRDSGIEGMARFLKRVDRLINYQLELKGAKKIVRNSALDLSMNKTIKEVTEDIENLRYNTAIAHIMEYVNELMRGKGKVDNVCLESLVLLLAPLAPFYAEEWWEMLGKKFSIHKTKWPEYDPEKIVFDTVVVAVQVNGKTRDTVEIQNSEVKDQKFVEEKARESEKIKKYLEGKEIKKVIYVAGKIINFVV